MSKVSSTLARVCVGILGAVSLAIGARIAYTSYLAEKILNSCIAGGSCPLNLNGLGLQSALSNSRGELLLGVALAVIGILALTYSFLFAGRLASPPLVRSDLR